VSSNSIPRRAHRIEVSAKGDTAAGPRRSRPPGLRDLEPHELMPQILPGLHHRLGRSGAHRRIAAIRIRDHASASRAAEQAHIFDKFVPRRSR